jgi:arylformamidase
LDRDESWRFAIRSVTDNRVVFDFEIEFANGGGLQGQDFRLDIDGDEITDEALAELLVADLRLLMVGAVRIAAKRVIEEPHKRQPTGAADARDRLVDLSHPIRDGMITYPGLPAPVIGTHLSRQESRQRYAPGTEFFIGTISMAGNTGTYVDAPFHRFPAGADLARLPLSALTDVPGVVIHARGRRAIDADALDDLDLDLDLGGRAVLFHTGWDRHFGTPAYGVEAPFLTAAAADRLIQGGAALVGIDSLNIDSTDGNERPVHTALLAAGVPIIEHLTGLGALPDRGFELTALPAPVEGLGSFPVRVVARVRG